MTWKVSPGICSKRTQGRYALTVDKWAYVEGQYERLQLRRDVVVWLDNKEELSHVTVSECDENVIFGTFLSLHYCSDIFFSLSSQRYEFLSTLAIKTLRAHDS